MLKRIVAKSEWQGSIQQGQKYILRVNRKEYDETHYICIEETINHEPTQEDKDALYTRYLELTKGCVVSALKSYAASTEVKSFQIGEYSDWFDDSKRTSIKNSVNAEKNAGRTETTIYVGGHPFVMSCDDALDMIDTIELYAKDCYVAVENHKASISSLTIIEDVEGYDYTSGFPERPVFD